jgi:Spy/CpxP family protein refolding chaperone
MKKLATTLGIMVLVGVLAVPVFAYRGGWGGRSHGPGYCWEGGGQYSNLTEEQRQELDKLEQKFHNDTGKLRREIWVKSDEFDTLMNTSDPDPKTVKALQKEQHRIDFELEARKIAPDGRHARGYGKGYGRHMRGYGPGGPYGSGPCWN